MYHLIIVISYRSKGVSSLLFSFVFRLIPERSRGKQTNKDVFSFFPLETLAETAPHHPPPLPPCSSFSFLEEEEEEQRRKWGGGKRRGRQAGGEKVDQPVTCSLHTVKKPLLAAYVKPLFERPPKLNKEK